MLWRANFTSWRKRASDKSLTLIRLRENCELAALVLFNPRIEYYEAIVIIHVERVEKGGGQQAVPNALGRVCSGETNRYIVKLHCTYGGLNRSMQHHLM